MSKPFVYYQRRAKTIALLRGGQWGVESFESDDAAFYCYFHEPLVTDKMAMAAITHENVSAIQVLDYDLQEAVDLFTAAANAFCSGKKNTDELCLAMAMYITKTKTYAQACAVSAGCGMPMHFLVQSLVNPRMKGVCSFRPAGLPPQVAPYSVGGVMAASCRLRQLDADKNYVPAPRPIPIRPAKQ